MSQPAAAAKLISSTRVEIKNKEPREGKNQMNSSEEALVCREHRPSFFSLNGIKLGVRPPNIPTFSSGEFLIRFSPFLSGSEARIETFQAWAVFVQPGVD